MEEIGVRLATDEDTDRINAFYNAVYKRNRTKAQFNWEFYSAPAGRAIYVIAEHNGAVVGTQCVIPYFLTTHSATSILSGKSEDTLVSPDYRGKRIFENMYALLLEECKKAGIEVIWGFTYASKPFLKLGFSVPFRARLGIFVLSPLKAYAYFASLAPNNGFINKSKILALSFLSRLHSLKVFLAPKSDADLDHEMIELNSSDFNYLKYDHTFGLKLDKAFLNYRISQNPYNKRYYTLNFRDNKAMRISMTFNITAQNVGYIIHTYIAEGVSQKHFREFLSVAIKSTDLKNCSAIRYWAFSENRQSQEELSMLKASGFISLNRGISFVWLPLRTDLQLNPLNFVISRMASQGTD